MVTDPGERIVNGQRRDDWSNPSDPRTYKRCWVDPEGSDEHNEEGEVVRVEYKVMMPADSIVHDNSKVRLPDGLDYQVVGNPKLVRSASGKMDHIELDAERWTA